MRYNIRKAEAPAAAGKIPENAQKRILNIMIQYGIIIGNAKDVNRFSRR